MGMITEGAVVEASADGVEEIHTFFHCDQCKRLRQTERLNAGITRTGFRVDCRKHGVVKNLTVEELGGVAPDAKVWPTEIHSFARCLTCVTNRETEWLEVGRTTTGVRIQCRKHGLVFFLTAKDLQREIERGRQCDCCPGGVHRS